MNEEGRTDTRVDQAPPPAGETPDPGAQMRRDRRVRLACALVVLASLGVCVALAVLQILERGVVDDYGETPMAVDEVEDPDAEELEEGEESALLGTLPVRIDGFRTVSRHEVPGFEREMVEAIYTPTAEEITIRTPLNCYVIVRAVGRQEIAEAFERLAAEHPSEVDSSDIRVASEQIHVARDRSTYVIVWRRGGHLVLVDSRFTLATPAEQGELLEIHGGAVAAAVAEEMRR